MIGKLPVKELKSSICKVPSLELGRKRLESQEKNRLLYRQKCRPSSKRYGTTAHRSQASILTKGNTNNVTCVQKNTGIPNRLSLSFWGSKNGFQTRNDKAPFQNVGKIDLCYPKCGISTSTSIVNKNKVRLICSKKKNIISHLSLRKENYSTVTQDNISVDKKITPNIVNLKGQITNKNQNALEKQIKHIDDILNRQFKKKIESTKALQNVVLNKIQDKNDKGTTTNSLKNNTVGGNKSNYSIIAEIFSKNESKQSHGHIPESNPPKFSKESQKNYDHIFEILKNKYSRKGTVQNEKITDVNHQQIYIKYKNNGHESSIKDSPIALKKGIVDEINPRTEKKIRLDTQTIKSNSITITPLKTEKNFTHSKPRIDTNEEKQLPETNLEKMSDITAVKMHSNEKVDHLLSESDVKKNQLDNQKNLAQSFRKSSSPKLSLSEPFDPLNTLTDKIKLKNMIEDSTNKTIESIKSEENKNIHEASHKHYTNSIGNDRRDGKKHPLPNLHNSQLFQNIRKLSREEIQFSHKSFKLNINNENYNDIKKLERKKLFNNIYTKHWVERKPPNFSFKKQVLLKPTFHPKPHKLNAQEIAEKIKARAKEINSRTTKDELLQPQMYCRKTIVLGLAQQPIMPCMNIINRNKRNTIYTKNSFPNSQRDTRGHVKRQFRKSNPIWPKQKWNTDNDITTKTSRLINSENTKLDLKGALKYLINFKSRLQDRKKN